ncbi:MAG TPA: HD domain-containing protein [Spirochaetota bacterium]|nr:HD domain-containing protein [Spirochaetota bacterium]HPJ41187.1 HD domain-containing protein [Spirochaetota bacterium]HPR38468.1 HD domain-containing protein [Spirochaetota bacterium]
MKENEKLKEIIKLGSDINTVQDLDILLERILFETRKIAGADAGTIYIKNRENLVFTHAQNDTLSARLAKGKKLIYSSFTLPITQKSLSGYAAMTGETVVEQDVYSIQGKPYGFDRSFDEKATYRTKSVMTIPLKNERDDILGVMQIINPKNTCEEIIGFSEEDMLYVNHFASMASMVIQKAQMTRALILRMIQMAELRDPKETGAHVNRVASYSVEMYELWAKHHSKSPEEIQENRDTLRMAAMLHDIGKVAISDLILKKPARFSREEFEIMKSHTYQGARIFIDAQSKIDEAARDVALTHHENWDGTGYPGRIDLATGLALEKDFEGNPLPLKGDEIPLFGRITALADVYDALSSRRVYKESWAEKEVFREISDLSGRKFDPEIVEIFFECIDVIKSIREKYPEAE